MQLVPQRNLHKLYGGFQIDSFLLLFLVCRDDRNNKNIHIHDIIGKDKYYGAIRGRKINGDDFYTQVVEYKNDGKSNCLTTVPKDNIVIDEFIESATSKSVKYRYYTPNEYEILQTIPLDYTRVVSDNIRRKLIGKSWTVDIISHVFSGIIGIN